jgi:hypothetical protein
LVFGLVVLVEEHFFAGADYPFFHALPNGRGVSQTERINFLRRHIESLHTQKIPHIPNLNHASNIHGHNLRGLRQALNPHQGMIMPPQQKYLLLHIGIPDKGLMIQPSRNQTLIHLTPITPIQRVHPLIMTPKLFLGQVGHAIPQADVAVVAGGHEGLL